MEKYQRETLDLVESRLRDLKEKVGEVTRALFLVEVWLQRLRFQADNTLKDDWDPLGR